MLTSPEELTGETINDTVYNQSLNTKERYNVKAEVVEVSPELVKKSVQSGDESYHIFTAWTSSGAGAGVLTGLTQNLYNYDAMETLTEGIYVDENGDGKAGFEDTYGLGESIPVSGVYRTAFDCTIMTRDADG